MATLTIQPDETSGLDTMLNSTNGVTTYNYGTHDGMYVKVSGALVYRGLIKFDISGLPGGATITAATLTMRTNYVDSATANDVGIHRALTQWYEGAKNGAAPDAGQDGSTWALRNANGSVQWTDNVAGGKSNGDYAASATATTSVTAIDTDYSWDVLTDVAAWYAGTATNHGLWILNAGTVGKKFHQSGVATEAYRPKLVIEYTAELAENPFYAYAQQ